MGAGAIIGGLLGGGLAIRGGAAVAHGSSGAAGYFLRSPIVQGGQFGIGYTGGAYTGYGVTNTWDPLGIHKPKYSYHRSNLGMPYGSYGRRRYSRYSGYTRYSRRSYYRRRRPYYRRYSY